MLIQVIAGATRTLGKSQGYIGLPIRDVVIECSVGGVATPAMESEWKPTAEELEALNKGGSIKLRVLGTSHPPVMLEVEAPPAKALASRITINGKSHDWFGPLISYEAAVQLAGLIGTPTAVYAGPRKGDIQRAGILSPGRVVPVENGLAFNIVHTTGA